MPLPAPLRRYDSMIDLIVEELVREVEAEMTGPHNESAPGVTTSEGASQHHKLSRRGAHADSTPAPRHSAAT